MRTGVNKSESGWSRFVEETKPPAVPQKSLEEQKLDLTWRL